MSRNVEEGRTTIQEADTMLVDHAMRRFLFPFRQRSLPFFNSRCHHW